MELGFDSFQGCFLCKPEIVKGEKSASNKVSSLRRLKKLQDPDVKVSDLVEILQTDPMLCIKLLRFVNFSKFQLNREIDSITSAIAIAGIKKVRSFAGFATMTSLASDKPQAVILEALSNAKMCEQIAKELGRDSDKYFATGLFSFVDAIVDQPMCDVLTDLSIDSEMTEAIQHSNGGCCRASRKSFKT